MECPLVRALSTTDDRSIGQLYRFTNGLIGHFACKRVPVGDDHAWLEKGNSTPCRVRINYLTKFPVLIEVQLLQRLSHPNLVSYRHVWLEDIKLNRFGPSVPCAFILQQYCNSGDLLHYIIGDGSPVLTPKEQLKMRRKSKGQAELPRDMKHSKVRSMGFHMRKQLTLFRGYLSSRKFIHSLRTSLLASRIYMHPIIFIAI
jgi:hypothetical protein